jgi:hypothetical protein
MFGVLCVGTRPWLFIEMRRVGVDRDSMAARADAAWGRAGRTVTKGKRRETVGPLRRSPYRGSVFLVQARAIPMACQRWVVMLIGAVSRLAGPTLTKIVCWLSGPSTSTAPIGVSLPMIP